MKDPDFLADAEKTMLEVDPVTGEEMEQILQARLCDAQGAGPEGGRVQRACGGGASDARPALPCSSLSA